ncbi:MAG: hypothetical protein DBX55_02105 [Verrucomicrobia bacterium]|nr:MAG: hypothetical protein DBX55_02105 [Verrucomicrobiota bacterium]
MPDSQRPARKRNFKTPRRGRKLTRMRRLSTDRTRHMRRRKKSADSRVFFWREKLFGQKCRR